MMMVASTAAVSAMNTATATPISSKPHLSAAMAAAAARRVA
jgi:hypothetical protein